MSVAAPSTFNPEEADNFEILRSNLPSKSFNTCPHTGRFSKRYLARNSGSQKMDDDIYEHLKTDFPEFDPAKTIDEDEMKSKTGKERWRKGDPKWEYGKDETIFVPRMQFYAIEIARNRSGLNDWIYENNQKEQTEAKA
ncbi:Protein PBDC1-like protein [Lachnellula subtilissima]|uniref:Protein PBDC1-like protein n=1 Tax=Lachnellula subtilissima TaxID=602034 RepID=A0A8H8RTT1_9HELO|nr:Protein PBDC1-like protein [Lachnellula subtilissima]